MRKGMILLLSVLAVLLVCQGPSALAQGEVEAARPYTFVPSACMFSGPGLGGMEIAPEDSGFECGYVTVPERHANPDGSTIRLPVAILRATSANPRPDPLFLAQGGPGGSAFEIFPLIVPGTAVALDRDMVIFNQRGTQYAEPELLCTELFDIAADLYRMPAEDGNLMAMDALRACHDRLLAEGIDLSAYNSLENAADVEAIRQALGYETYNFYGVSYGTLLGLHLMRDYPEHLRSVVLDSVVPTNLNFIPFVPQNENRIYDELFRACEADAACRESYPNLEQRFSALVAKLNAEPVTVRLVDPETGQRVDARLDGAVLLELLFQVFYLGDTPAIFPRLLQDIENGDYFYLEQIWPLFAFDRTVSDGMYFSVICAEDADFDPGEVPLDSLRPEIAATVEDTLGIFQDVCSYWQVEPLPPSVDDPVTSEVPALLLSGQFDPITPPAFAAVADASLPNAYHVVDPYASHGVAFGQACVDQIVLDFLNAPEMAPDPSCLEAREPGALVPPNALAVPALARAGQLGRDYLVLLGAASVLLLIVLSGYAVWSMAFIVDLLRGTRREMTTRQKWLRWLGRGMVLAFGALAVGFVLATAGLFVWSFVNVTPLTMMYVLPGITAPLFVVPLLLALLAVGIGVTAVLLWREGVESVWGKLYYALLAVSALGYVIVLALDGYMTVLI